MKAPKKTKSQRIAELEIRLAEALAGQAFVYASATQDLPKASTDNMMGSGVVLRLHALGGRELIKPVLIRDGLGFETIAALKADLVRSYELAVCSTPPLKEK